MNRIAFASRKARVLVVAAAGVLVCAAHGEPSRTNWLSELDLGRVRQGWGKARKDRSVSGAPMRVAGEAFSRGVGTHARSVFWIRCPADALRFQAKTGVDDSAKGTPGSVVFRVYADGKRLWDSGVMRPGQRAKPVDLPIRGARLLTLIVEDGGDGISYDHADWAEARILTEGGKPEAIAGPEEPREIRTPPFPKKPEIHGPSVYGCRPGRPFLYRIPATGQRPMRFAAEGLPSTIRLDPKRGVLEGTAPARGEYRALLRAENAFGKDSKPFKIVSGDVLALTPPMGWNHWYAHYQRVTDATIRQAADAMVESGMADVGYQYVCIDDCWMRAPKSKDPLRVGPLRDAQGNILPNGHFPDMKGLTAYIHAKGLKAGLYTSPGPFTCAGFAGSYGHEQQDVDRFVEWGFDFLKYDWCSYGRTLKRKPTLEDYKRPYRLMGRILRRARRDIVFNLCQYGMGDVWEWGREVGGNSWRTGGDLGFELNRIFEVALRNAAIGKWNGPGGWNDPDYIQIGYVGDARGGGLPRPCPLSPNEQYAFFSMWCLLAAPLFYSGDMTRLDPFTLNILCNPELIEVDQDPLGLCGKVHRIDENLFLLIKPLADGSRAVGLFNQGEFPAETTLEWRDLGLRGPQRVRDLWRRQDLGVFAGALPARVGRRSGEVYRFFPLEQPAPADRTETAADAAPWPHFFTGEILPPPQESRALEGPWTLCRKGAPGRIAVFAGPDAPRAAQIAAAEICERVRRLGFPKPRIARDPKEADAAAVLFELAAADDAGAAARLRSAGTEPVLRPEGYAIGCRRRKGRIWVTALGADAAGLCFAGKTLQQMLEPQGEKLLFHPRNVRDWPVFRLRSFKGEGQDWAALRAIGRWAPNGKFNCLDICYTTLGPDQWPRPSEAYKSFVREMARFMRPRGLDVMPFVNPYYLWKEHIEVSDEKDLEALARTCAIGPSAGCGRVMLCLDDFASKPVRREGRLYRVASPKDRERFGDDLARVNAAMIRDLYGRLRREFPSVKLYVVPPYYWTPRDDYRVGGERYLRRLSEAVPPDVRLVWTGPIVRSLRIARADVEHYQGLVRRKVMLWDNTIYARHNPRHYLFDPFATQYPDRFWELMSGEVHYNAAALEIYRVGLLCAGSYLWNPQAYDAQKTLRLALAAVAGPEAVEPALAFRDAFNAFWDKWMPRLGAADKFLRRVKEAKARFLSDQEIEALERAAKTLEETLAAFRKTCRNKTLVRECEIEARRFLGYREALRALRALPAAG